MNTAACTLEIAKNLEGGTSRRQNGPSQQNSLLSRTESMERTQPGLDTVQLGPEYQLS